MIIIFLPFQNQDGHANCSSYLSFSSFQHLYLYHSNINKYYTRSTDQQINKLYKRYTHLTCCLHLGYHQWHVRRGGKVKLTTTCLVTVSYTLWTTFWGGSCWFAQVATITNTPVLLTIIKRRILLHKPSLWLDLD